MSFYSELADVATDLLTELGQTITARNYGLGAYDPATGTNTATFSDTTAKGALFKFDSNQTTYAGTDIQKDDRKLLLDVSGGKPADEDHILVGADEYSILSVQEINPAGIAVAFELHIRK